MSEIKISRKEFIRYAMYLVWISVIVSAIQMIKGQIRPSDTKVKIPLSSIPEGITFRNEMIIIRSSNKFSIFSSKCSHLGCKINHEVNGKIVCPCHGSEFNLSGQAVKGPAFKSLAKLDFEIDSASNQLIVNL